MITLNYNSRGEEVKLLQKALAEHTGNRLSFDGHFGQLTSRALINYQQSKGLKTTGVYDAPTYELLGKFIDEKYIRVKDLDEHAHSIQVDPKILKALAMKEAKASGFTSNGKCLILYERHIFHRYALKKFGATQTATWSRQNPNLCSNVWSHSAYYGGEREWERLNAAKNWDAETALLSCSWGMFQIMGFNYELAGYPSVSAYVADMTKSEHCHAKALTGFVKNHRQLYAAIKSKNFEQIALYYNGPGYRKNNYDTDLRKIYQSLT